jgi:hypothetical protein
LVILAACGVYANSILRGDLTHDVDEITDFVKAVVDDVEKQ